MNRAHQPSQEPDPTKFVTVITHAWDGVEGYVGAYHTHETLQIGRRREPVAVGDYCVVEFKLQSYFGWLAPDISGTAGFIELATARCYACEGDLNLRPIYEGDEVWGYVCESCKRELTKREEYEDFADEPW